MKRLLSTIPLILLSAGMLLAGIDGKWSFETKLPEGKAKRGIDTITTTLDLKTDGAKLMGTISSTAGKRGRSMEIKEGKVEGDKLNFTTVQSSKKKGEVTIHWTGTLEGDQLKLTRMNKKGKRSQDFVAKRQ